MSTVFFNLVTLPYATTNAIEVRLYKVTSPNAIVASQSKPAPHPQTTWSFPGLDRENYIVRIFDMASIPFQIGADFTFIPDNNEVRYHDPVWIEFDVTANPDGGIFASGTNTFTVAEWIGWDIIFDRKGADTQDIIDILWDKTTGIATLQQPGDLFQPNEKWFLLFQPLIQASSSVSSAPTRLWSSRKYITASEVLTEADAGKKIIIKSATPYLEVTLPDLSLTSEDLLMWIESGRVNQLCIKISCTGSDVIDWFGAARTSIYLIRDETVEIYKEVDSGIGKWRIQNAPSQYKHVGKFISYYNSAAACIPADNSTYNIRSYARLYEEFVKMLGGTQVCNYADWGTANNKYKFSLADVETDSGVFHVPDLRDQFERAAGTAVASIWEDFMMEDHFHFETIGELPSPPFGLESSPIPNIGQYGSSATHGVDRTSDAKISSSGLAAKIGLETRPQNYRAIKGILI